MKNYCVRKAFKSQPTALGRNMSSLRKNFMLSLSLRTPSQTEKANFSQSMETSNRETFDWENQFNKYFDH